MALENILRKAFTISMMALSSLMPLSCSNSNPTELKKNEPTQPVQSINRAPYFNSSPITQVNEGEAYWYFVKFMDPDGDPLVLSKVMGPDWLNIYDNNSIAGMPPEVQQAKGFPVKLGISDGKNLAIQEYVLTVNNLRNVYSLNPQQKDVLVNVTGDHLTFLENQNFSIGDIIVTGIHKYAPYGTLREVTSISTNNKIFYTKTANLEDALTNEFLAYSNQLKPSSSQSFTGLEGVSMADSEFGFDFGFNLKNVVLYDLDGNLLTTGDQVIANGNISFDADVILNADFGVRKLNRFAFLTNFREKADLSVGLNAFGLAYTKSIEIASYYLNPIVIPATIPIIAVPKLSLSVGFNSTKLNPLGVSVNQELNINTYLDFKDGAFNADADISNSFNFSQPVFTGDAGIEVSAQPRLDFLFYGVAGPSVGIKTGLKFESQSPKWKLYAELSGFVGAEMEVLKKGISAYGREVISLEKLLAEGGKEPTNSLIDKIAFVRSSNPPDIWIMNSDGSSQENITSTPGNYEENPSWFPDKTKIAFDTFINGNGDIYAENLITGQTERITTSSADDWDSDLSPDGKNLVFVSNRDGNYEIYKIDLETRQTQRLTYTSSDEYAPNWSSRGILFESNVHGGWHEIYFMNPDGSGIKRLTYFNDFHVGQPSWSPDGNKIIFSGPGISDWDIWVMNPDGSSQKNISRNVDTDDIEPFFSPDGSQIIYISKPKYSSSDSWEIWKMKADGTGVTRLTNNSWGERSPVWH